MSKKISKKKVRKAIKVALSVLLIVAKAAKGRNMTQYDD